MPIVPFIPAIISGAGSLVGGAIASHGAKTAAQQQSAAALGAGKLVTDAAASVNPTIANAAAGAGHDVSVAAGNAGAGVSNAADTANGFLSPYMAAGSGAAGTLADLMKSGGDLNRSFTGADMEAYDPGYQFRMQQGTNAIQNSQAAKGMVNSGSTLKALTRFGQDYGSNEFTNAFNRFQTEGTNRFTRLSSLMGMGLQSSGAAGNNVMGAATYGGNAGMTAAEYGGNAGMNATALQSNNTMNAAQFSGNAMMGAGNANAAGTVASSNAWGAGIGGAANSVGSALMLNKLMKPVNYSGGGGGGGNGYGGNSATPYGGG